MAAPSVVNVIQIPATGRELDETVNFGLLSLSFPPSHIQFSAFLQQLAILENAPAF